MRVFISRPLAPESIFASMLAERGHSVRGFSLVEFSALPFAEVPAADWVFFYSQNAVEFFFKNLIIKELPTPEAKWAAIGEATAKALEKALGRKTDFIGSGEPEKTAESFRGIAEGKKVLFPCARNSRHSIRRALGPSVSAMNLAVYENTPLPCPPLPDEDVLVFTSPMNAGAWFAKNRLRAGQKTVAIGRATEAALRKLGAAEIFVSPETSERSLAETVLKFVA